MAEHDNGYEPIDADALVPKLVPALKLKGRTYRGYVNDDSLPGAVEMEGEAARQVWLKAFNKAVEAGGTGAPREWKLYTDALLTTYIPDLAPEDAAGLSTGVRRRVFELLGVWKRVEPDQAAEDGQGKAPPPSTGLVASTGRIGSPPSATAANPSGG